MCVWEIAHRHRTVEDDLRKDKHEFRSGLAESTLEVQLCGRGEGSVSRRDFCT